MISTKKAVAIGRRPTIYTESERGQAWAELRRKALNVPQWRAQDLKKLSENITNQE